MNAIYLLFTQFRYHPSEGFLHYFYDNIYIYIYIFILYSFMILTPFSHIIIIIVDIILNTPDRV